MATGRVKFFSTKRGFGFITPDEGEAEIYFCRASLPRDRQYDPCEGDEVAYEERKSNKGMMAVRMELL